MTRQTSAISTNHAIPRHGCTGIGRSGTGCAMPGRCGKRVERNADRQDDVVIGWLVIDADACGQHLEIAQEELAVLEPAEHAEVCGYGRQHPGASTPWTGRFGDAVGRPPVDHRGDPQQDDERRVPRRVEDVARDQQVDLAGLPSKRQRMQRKNEREEQRERQRIENHASPRVRGPLRGSDSGPHGRAACAAARASAIGASRQ